MIQQADAYLTEDLSARIAEHCEAWIDQHGGNVTQDALARALGAVMALVVKSIGEHGNADALEQATVESFQEFSIGLRSAR